MSDGPGHQVRHAEAMVLLQEVLDEQSRALLTGDVALMRRSVALPYRRMTVDVDVIIETEADFARGITAFHESLRSLAVNQFFRLVTDAEFLNDTLIEGHYIAYALRNATPMVPSYDNRIVLQCQDGVWRMIEVASNLVAKRWPLDLLRVAPSGSVRSEPCRDDVRRAGAEPLKLYQSFLDSLTCATMTRDFDAYIALCDLPYTSHSAHHDAILCTVDDVRPFFDLTVEMTDGTAADTFVRSARAAHFLGPDVLCGYHASIFSKAGVTTLPPIKSRMILRRDGAAWKLKHVTNAIANTSYPYSVPVPTDALPTHREIQERTKSWPTSH